MCLKNGLRRENDLELHSSLAQFVLFPQFSQYSVISDATATLHKLHLLSKKRDETDVQPRSARRSYVETAFQVDFMCVVFAC